jgi:hypothetical protein
VLGSIVFGFLMPKDIAQVAKYRIMQDKDGKEMVIIRNLQYKSNHNDL